MIGPRTPQVTDPGRIIAHRGASSVAPENTLEAMRAAAEAGAYWIEFDVMLIGDGTPVVHHDATLDRCTDHSGPLMQLESASLANIHAGKRFGDAYPLARIPTLEQTLDLIEELAFYANLEIKMHHPSDGVLAAKVADALARRPWTRERIIVSSFDHTELERFREAAPDQPIALLYDKIAPDWRETAIRLSAAALHIHFAALSASMVTAIRKEGLDVRIFTLNRPELGVPLREAGLTSVITDDPARFLSEPDWKAWAETHAAPMGQPIWP